MNSPNETLIAGSVTVEVTKQSEKGLHQELTHNKLKLVVDLAKTMNNYVRQKLYNDIM